MPVTPLLASIANMPDVAPASVLTQVWRLAENSNDLDVMQDLAGRPGALPDEVVERVRLRKEAPVRIAYLSRQDLPDEERAALLGAEKRSEVFAGLIAAARENEALASRLAEQFVLKPTKLLARQMLREDFGDVDLQFECLKTLVGERNPAEWLWRKMRSIVKECASNAERSNELAGILPLDLAMHLEVSVLDEPSQLTLIGRLASRAALEYPKKTWESRRLISNVSRFLVATSALPGLPDAVVEALDILATAEWMEEGDRVAGALAGRRAVMQESSVDEQRLAARTATGAKLDGLVRLALADNTSGSETFIQGLLENPAAWSHDSFNEVVTAASPAFLVKAVQATRSHDLMSRLWKLHHRYIPDACWEYVDDLEKLNERLVMETLAGDHPPYHAQGLIASLLARGISDEALGRVPYDVVAANHYSRRYHSPVLEEIAPQLVRLQLQALGENTQYWENFNNLAADWSGTIQELLDASTNL